MIQLRLATDGKKWRVQGYVRTWHSFWLKRRWQTLRSTKDGYEWDSWYTNMTGTKEDAERWMTRYVEDMTPQNPFLPEEQK